MGWNLWRSDRGLNGRLVVEATMMKDAKEYQTEKLYNMILIWHMLYITHKGRVRIRRKEYWLVHYGHAVVTLDGSSSPLQAMYMFIHNGYLIIFNLLGTKILSRDGIKGCLRLALHWHRRSSNWRVKWGPTEFHNRPYAPSWELARLITVDSTFVSLASTQRVDYKQFSAFSMDTT